MYASPLAVVRFAAWAIALGAVGAVMLAYDSLPDTLPVTRWTTAPKSLLIALRIPLINLLTMGLIESLSPALHRAKEFHRSNSIVILLLLTAAAKAAIEAAGILRLPVSFSWTLMPLVAVLVVGLGTAAFLGRDFLDPRQWGRLELTRVETAGSLALVCGIVALNLPLVLR